MRAFPLSFSRVPYAETMPITLRRESLTLFVGDMVFLILSLWATLFLRYADIPTSEIFFVHLLPFSFLFLLSALVFFIAGLYEKHTLLFKSQLPETILYAQVANIAVGAIFFFFVPYFGIQPKTNLFIYLLLSTLFVSLWRLYLVPFLSLGTRAEALLIGEGSECEEIMGEVNGNNRYAIRFVGGCVRPDDVRTHEALARRTPAVSVVVMPFSYGAFLPEWDALMFSGVRFVDSARLYEDLFDRVSLPLVDQRWFLEEQTRTRTIIYAFAKRLMDIVISALALVVLSPLFILVLCIFSFSYGHPFIFQKRVGQGNKEIRIIKFRTMLFDDSGDPEKQKQNRITRFGAFLRKTQIDEMPQFWNVLRGDLSLIGPRPEIPALVEEYKKQIPFYDMRHLLQPGISGWAQIKHASPPKFSVNVEATKKKLSYDLYYLKHRSFLLDLMVVLRTIKIILSRAGR